MVQGRKPRFCGLDVEVWHLDEWIEEVRMEKRTIVVQGTLYDMLPWETIINRGTASEVQ